MDDLAGSEGSQQTGEVTHAVGEGHEDAGEARRDVQVVHLEPRVDASVEADPHRQDGDCQHRVTPCIRGGDQRKPWPVLTCAQGR